VFLNASLVREIARMGGEIAGLLPANVEQRVLERFADERAHYRAQG
jgi:phosphopantetheine adenylyltransferase